MDISNIKLGEVIDGLKCPKCKAKNMKVTGRKPDRVLTSCFDCFHEEWVDPKDVQFTYQPPKEPKKKKENKSEGEE